MLEITSSWKSVYPGAVVGILVMHDVANPEHHPELEKQKAILEDQLRDRYFNLDRGTLERLPEIEAYQTYYRSFKKTYHLLLQLESVVFKHKPIPHVAALVEAVFMAELQDLLLTAGHGLETVQVPIRLDVARGNELYTALRGEEQILKQGDMFIADTLGVISSVIYGPDLRTSIKPGTRSVLFTTYAPAGIGEEAVHRHLQNIRSNVLIISPNAETESLELYSA
ncbi:MAG TPA: hypothetical protein VI755_11395 [Anaerolineales bacterium]|nr:hypothetical protein [Anaerolineales bacterium]